MTTREYNAVAGRFLKVDETDDHVIVGLIGSLWSADLTADQLAHIKGFYQKSFHRHTFLRDYNVSRNASMYNEFIQIEKRSPAPNWMNKYQKEDFESACLKISGIRSPRDFYRVMDEIDFYGTDVVNCAREYMRCYNSEQYR